MQEKRCAIQIKEVCSDCPNTIIIEKLLEEANRSMNGCVGSVSTLANGGAEVSETHVPDNNSVSQEVRITVIEFDIF